MKKSETDILIEAIEIIQELLKGGQHKGKCTNYISPGVYTNDVCELHLEASERRRKKAEDFLYEMKEIIN